LFTLRGKLYLYGPAMQDGLLLYMIYREGAFISTGTGPLLVITPYYLPWACVRSNQGQTQGSHSLI